jgi:hypothetical protein
MVGAVVRKMLRRELDKESRMEEPGREMGELKTEGWGNLVESFRKRP